MKESKYKYSQNSSFQAAASKVASFYVHHLLSQKLSLLQRDLEDSLNVMHRVCVHSILIQDD